jgi:CHAD domain-containing protein
MPFAPEHTRVVFAKLERDLVKLSSERQPETVHRFRTGTRRLQTLLEDIFPDRDRNQKKLLKLLTRLRKRAGKVRDLDVQLAALRSLKTPQEPRRKTQLMHRLIELRAQHDKKLRKALDKETVREIRKRLKRASKELNLDGVRDPLAAAEQMLVQAPRSEGAPSEELLHQYRILTKRARYAAEFAAKSPQADQFIAQLRRVQDALGDWHDWLMLTQSAARRLDDLRHSSLLAVLRNVTGAKSRRAAAMLPASASAQAAPGPAMRPPHAVSQKRGASTSLASLHTTSAA